MKGTVFPLLALVISISGAFRIAATSSLADPALSRSESLNPARLPDILVPAPSGTNRVTVGAVIQPATALPGDTVTVFVKIRIAPGHWIYALENSGSRSLPTVLETASDGPPFRSAGTWRGPEPKTKEDGSRVYAREVVFQRRFVFESSAKETARKLPIAIKYQVCNEALCWPPATISLEPMLKVVPSP